MEGQNIKDTWHCGRVNKERIQRQLLAPVVECKFQIEDFEIWASEEHRWPYYASSIRTPS